MKNDNKQDNSPYVHGRNKIKIDLNIREIKFNEKQRDIIKSIQSHENKVTFIKGCAGVGKTYLAIYCALKSLNEKKTSDLIYIRPIVESAEHRIGYLPGDRESKLEPYNEVLEEKLTELLPKTHIDALKNDGRVHSLPVNYARGVHIAGKFVVIDEASSFNAKELLTLMTRIGEFSKVIICADPMQSDLKNGQSHDFEKVYNLFNDEISRQNGIFCFELTEADIVRSKLCAFVIKKFTELNKPTTMF